MPSGVTRNTAYTAWARSENTFDSVNLNHNWMVGGNRMNELVVQFSHYLNDIPTNQPGPSITLASGAKADYYVDARRALLRPAGFLAAGELIAAAAVKAGAGAVGGPATAAIPPACAALAVPAGKDLVGFFVRGERKQHGLQRWVEGPVERGASVLVVEDTVTTGGSTVKAIDFPRTCMCGIIITSRASVLNSTTPGGAT